MNSFNDFCYVTRLIDEPECCFRDRLDPALSVEPSGKFQYEQAVPWGRSFDEYRDMFSLTEADLEKRILGCGDGPASFNAGLSRHGGHVVSCDPLYHYSAKQIQARIEATYHKVLNRTRQNRDRFVWDRIGSPEELGRIRMEAMREFLADYHAGKKAGRYVVGELPELPFGSDSFDLAICSHFLFLYSDNYSLSFHRKAVDELCRVATEVRIFPLLTYNGQPSPFAAPIVEHLQVLGLEVSVEEVPYEFQRGGTKMLRARRTLAH